MFRGMTDLRGEFALSDKIDKARGAESDALETMRHLRRTGGGKITHGEILLKIRARAPSGRPIGRKVRSLRSRRQWAKLPADPRWHLMTRSRSARLLRAPPGAIARRGGLSTHNRRRDALDCRRRGRGPSVRA